MSNVVDVASCSAEELLMRLDEIESMISGLGSTRSGTELSVTNPRMGAQRAQCPAGTYVSAISAPKGIGGKYGVGGISGLAVTCSAIAPN